MPWDVMLLKLLALANFAYGHRVQRGGRRYTAVGEKSVRKAPWTDIAAMFLTNRPREGLRLPGIVGAGSRAGLNQLRHAISLRDGTAVMLLDKVEDGCTVEDDEAACEDIMYDKIYRNRKAAEFENLVRIGDGTDLSAAAPVIEPPREATPLERTIRALTFYSRVLPVGATYKLQEAKLWWERELLDREIPAEEEQQLWDELNDWGSDRIFETIADMQGYYVKTGQVISTRVDLFPEQYTSKLTKLQDGLKPMPPELVRSVVEQELLNGQPLSELFSHFDTEPLGTASIAQVHKATLLDGRTVAVKLQRPNVDAKLRGDIANLKRISKQFREQLPLDYYAVFEELGRILNNELDFFQEAQAMRKIGATVERDSAGNRVEPAVLVPQPVGEIVSRRVLVMDFIEGAPLNQLQEIMKEKNIDPDSPKAKVAGARILEQLSLAFERMIVQTGFVHGDPHPGNIFVGEGGRVSLIDCGQVRTLTREKRLGLAKVVLQVSEYQKAVRDPEKSQSDVRAELRALADAVNAFGLEFDESIPDSTDLAAAVALFLFGDAGIKLPGGFSSNELSSDSPIKSVTVFPQDLVLMGRACVLLKGISKKLGIPFSLADSWADSARKVVATAGNPEMAIWDRINECDIPNNVESTAATGKLRLRDAVRPLRAWAGGKVKRAGGKAFGLLPKGVRSRVEDWVVARMLRKKKQKLAGK